MNDNQVDPNMTPAADPMTPAPEAPAADPMAPAPEAPAAAPAEGENPAV